MKSRTEAERQATKTKMDRQIKAYISGKLSEGYTPRKILELVWLRFGYSGNITSDGKVYVNLNSGQMEIK